MEQHNTIDYFDYHSAIITLIADDLRVSKLINGLTKIGLDASNFNSKIHETIFLLIGFKKYQQTDELKDWYFQQSERIFRIELTADEKDLNTLANDIYSGLVERLNGVVTNQ